MKCDKYFPLKVGERIFAKKHFEIKTVDVKEFMHYVVRTIEINCVSINCMFAYTVVPAAIIFMLVLVPHKFYHLPGYPPLLLCWSVCSIDCYSVKHMNAHPYH